MNLRSIIVLLIFELLILTSAFSQEEYSPTNKKTECLLSLSHFQPAEFSLGYKRQIKNNRFFKIALVDLNYSTDDRSPQNSTLKASGLMVNGGFIAGLEFRKQLNTTFTLYHGPGLGGTYNFSKQILPQAPGKDGLVISQRFSPQVIYTIGILARLTDHFYFAAEINPSVIYNYSMFSSPSSHYNETSIRVNVGNKNASVSLVYNIN